MMKKLTDTALNKPLRCFMVIFLGAGLYVFFVALFDKSLADYDLWGYLAFGRVFWQEGFFPYKDVFSYTPTQPLWVYHEWLTGVVFFGLIKFLGPASLQLLRYVLSILTIYFMYETALKKGGTSFYAIISLIPAMLLISFGYVPVRAQIFTFFFFILTLYILECSKKTGNEHTLGWLPLIQILWCNFHGGFVSGLGLIFLYALGESLIQRKIAVSYLKWGMIASLVTLINPYGIDYWTYTIHAIIMPRPEITEWYSVVTALKSNIHIFPVVLFLIMSLMILLVMLVYRQKDITEIFVVAAVIYLGSVHIRHGILFALVFGAYMPFYLSEHTGKSKVTINRKRLLAIIISTVLIMAYFNFYPVKQISLIPSFRFLVSADYYPVKAIHWIKSQHLKGNILPHFEWGEYLIWSLYPDYRVAMDGRYETVYRNNVHREYFDFLYGREPWEVFLKKYPHDMVLLKAGTRTHRLMIGQREWRMGYQDQRSVIFVRKDFITR